MPPVLLATVVPAARAGGLRHKMLLVELVGQGYLGKAVMGVMRGEVLAETRDIQAVEVGTLWAKMPQVQRLVMVALAVLQRLSRLLLRHPLALGRYRTGRYSFQAEAVVVLDEEEQAVVAWVALAVVGEALLVTHQTPAHHPWLGFLIAVVVGVGQVRGFRVVLVERLVAQELLLSATL